MSPAPPPLRDLRVVELSDRIAGSYAAKLFVDAGAEVIKVEPPEGDPLRQWTASGRDLAGEDSALFCFLNAGKQSWVGALEDERIGELLESADVVIETPGSGSRHRQAWRERFPHLVWVAISPYGLEGPWAERPASEFTVQAESGSVAGRGLRNQPPFMAGGRITEWVAGSYGAVAALAAALRARRDGAGELIDVSMLEIATLTMTLFSDLSHSLASRPKLKSPQRSVEIPSIEPTKDGWVGFNTNSRQQYQDFLLLIERTDLLADEELALIVGRIRRMEEWNAIVRYWTRRHTTEEIVERAALLRIPVGPVHDGKGVLDNEHFRARGVFRRSPEGFLEPRRPYQIGDVELAERRPAPKRDEHGGIAPRTGRPAAKRGAQATLPLDGIRVLDATGWWAGPSAGHILAALGAEVIHLESIQRPDGGRMFTGRATGNHSAWWERSPLFLTVNANKKSLTLDLRHVAGIDLCRSLIRECDVVLENFSPRVFENFGLGWDQLHALSPRTILVRMPAFGLDGPWRDRVGFAQTMEQVTGLAWLTGHADDQPRVQSGPCDPNAGMHAAFAALVALVERERSGEGRFVECAMVESALNAAAEMIVEYSAYGHRMQRDGNRAPWAAPQNLYACRGQEEWLALSVETPEQWEALKDVLGRPAWAAEPGLATLAGRRAAHDAIDAELGKFAAERELGPLLEELIARGVPAGRVRDGRTVSDHPQHEARGFYEQVVHPVAGTHPVSTVPFRFASCQRWVRTHAPTLGQHNADILGGLLGLSSTRISELEKNGVVGSRPLGV
jgi:crotonobetainyl-CoA:carnitine CoA-transferase CaiB-like acyl-CoA transferase